MKRLLVVAGLFVAGCSAIDPHNMIGRQLGEATGILTEPVPGSQAKVLDTVARERAFETPIG